MCALFISILIHFRTFLSVGANWKNYADILLMEIQKLNEGHIIMKENYFRRTNSFGGYYTQETFIC
jgi:hypothetical protein